jgi:guanine nucleotide-binding protein alpha-1 subunit
MVGLTGRSEDSADPLAQVLSPPPDETPEQCAIREAREAEARRVSERIDEQIRLEKQAKARTKIPVKVLMLGQAESGAPCFIFPPPRVSCVLTLACRQVYDGKKSFCVPILPDRRAQSKIYPVFQMSFARRGWEEERMSWRTVIHLNLVRSVNTILDALENVPETANRVNLLRIRLSPLRRVQHDLENHLGLAEGEEVHATPDTGILRRPAEVCVRSRGGWGAVLGLAKQRAHSPGRRSLAEEAKEVILMSRDDIAALWGDDDVRAALEVRGVRLEDLSGL